MGSKTKRKDKGVAETIFEGVTHLDVGDTWETDITNPDGSHVKGLGRTSEESQKVASDKNKKS